jgi:hypothetical protein
MADKRLVEGLLEQIEAIPYVDSHTHVPLPAVIQGKFADSGFRYDATYLLGGCTYVAQFLGGKTWPEVREKLVVSSQNAYYRPMAIAMRDLYGLEGELDDSNVDAVSERMDAAHRDPMWYSDVLKRANLRHIVWMDWNGLDEHLKPANQVPGVTLHPVWNVDWSIYFYGKSPAELDDYAYQHGAKPENFCELLEMHDAALERFLGNGGVCLKSTSAYFRPLVFDSSVTHEQAAAAFAKVIASVELSPAEQRQLQDFCILRFFRIANERKLPFQLHTGNQQEHNRVEDSSPLKLNDLLLSGDYPDVRFVLLHGGFPYTRESIMLAKYFKEQVTLDLCWMCLFSPAAAKQTLSIALDMLDGSQVMLGSDCANFEELYGTVKITRRVVAEVLAEKVESGIWSEKVALRAAERVLNRNAVELYGLEA